jgi:hypothetical protein
VKIDGDKLAGNFAMRPEECRAFIADMQRMLDGETASQN